MAKKVARKTATTSAKKTAHQPGPKDRSYVNKNENYEVQYEPKRKSPAKKFGAGTRSSK
jgi:hypothetical protein